LHNAPKQRRLAQKLVILSERNLLIPNTRLWNREFAKPFSVEKLGGPSRTPVFRKSRVMICRGQPSRERSPTSSFWGGEQTGLFAVIASKHSVPRRTVGRTSGH